MKSTVILKIEADFKEEAEFHEALEELGLLHKNWDNKWGKVGQIKYFIKEE